MSTRGYRSVFKFLSVLTLAAAALVPSHAQFSWEVGMNDNAWPLDQVGGGPEADFVQEAGTNPLPGNPASEPANGQADDDYYFAGVYTQIIPANGDYEPVGVVAEDEIAMERAFAGTDNDKRFHFNFPATTKTNDLFSVTFDALNLDTGGSDPRYGIEIYVNGVKVQDEIIIRSAQLNTPFTTRQFSVAEVGGKVGPEFDNIVYLKGISKNDDGGGAWMGFDYIQLNQESVRIPPAVVPWSVGKNDNGWPVGDGGGTNATFVQENSVVNPLPGSPSSPEVNQQADNDYYFAGLYTNVIAGNGTYEPVGLVSTNEEAAERAFAGTANELRYHFNLPNTLLPTDSLSVTFDALNLDDPGAVNTDVRYGVEVWVNGVRVQPQILIRPAQLNVPQTTPAFTLASVNARVGSGHDNIVTLKGINYNAEGGGNWMGIDYVALNTVAAPIPTPVLPLPIGANNNGHPAGDGGGANTSFVQENGATNALPGNPNSPETNQQADDDYYFAGVYSTVIPGNGTYTPVGTVQKNEEAAERAFAGADNFLRYHFNLPPNLSSNDMLAVSFDALDLHTDGQANPRYGIEIYFNGVKVQNEIVITPDQLGVTYSTQPFTLASVKAQPGFGFDNIVTLKGINYNAEGGGNWMGIDFVQISAVIPPPFPWSVGRDDNSQPAGNGGGANATFVQETGGINPLPGNPANAEVNQQADNDYYFAGLYTNAISSVVAEAGEYTPVGQVLVNEEAAERAFAAADNDLRYHFNLPSHLLPTDQLVVSYDTLSLHTDGQADPRYGIEVWVNGVKVQDEIVVRPDMFDIDFITAPFTLASVNAQVGPGHDNIVSLRGVNYNADGGGNWMGIDYVNLDPVPKPFFPIQIGKDDDAWPVGDGGGTNATFVQENGTVNDLPGSATNREVNQQSDNDYYLAGIYTNVIASNGAYEPIGLVARHEESAERAFVPGNNELRYHFNLPSTLTPTSKLAVTFDALNLHTDAMPDPRYGVEVYFNNVLVQPQILIRTNQLGIDYTTPGFTLASVNAQTGAGSDNIVTLKGVDYSAEGGGSWMGIDYVRIHADGETTARPQFNTPLVLSNGRITLTWTGTGVLESTPTLNNPTWTPIVGATSGYTEDVSTAPRRFYRLRAP